MARAAVTPTLLSVVLPLLVLLSLTALDTVAPGIGIAPESGTMPNGTIMLNETASINGTTAINETITPANETIATNETTISAPANETPPMNETPPEGGIAPKSGFEDAGAMGDGGEPGAMGGDGGNASVMVDISTCLYSISSGGYYQLTADLQCTGGYAVQISASNAEFNCNGRTITGTDVGTTKGISVVGPVTGITIRDCPDIRNWSSGIYASRMNASSISRVNITDSTFGIELLNSSFNNLSVINSNATIRTIVAGEVRNSRFDNLTINGTMDLEDSYGNNFTDVFLNGSFQLGDSVGGALTYNNRVRNLRMLGMSYVNLYWGYGNHISGVSSPGTQYTGIGTQYTNHSSISGFDFRNGRIVVSGYSHNNTIGNGTVRSSSYSGLYLGGGNYPCDNNTFRNVTINNTLRSAVEWSSAAIRGNRMENINIHNANGSGLYLAANSHTNNSFAGFYISNVTDYGVRTFNAPYVNNTFANFTIFYPAYYGMFLMTSTPEYYGRYSLTNITVAGAGLSGIYLSNVHNSSLRNITITGCNDSGIYIDGSADGNFSDATLLNNTYGIWISGGYMQNNRYRSITINNSRQDLFFGADGGTLDNFRQLFSTNVTVGGKPVYWYVDGQTLDGVAANPPQNAGFIAFINSSNRAAGNLSMRNNSQGVVSRASDNITITNVTITGAFRGIVTNFDTNWTITNVTITDNYYFNSNSLGITLVYGTNHTVSGFYGRNTGEYGLYDNAGTDDRVRDLDVAGSVYPVYLEWVTAGNYTRMNASNGTDGITLSYPDSAMLSSLRIFNNTNMGLALSGSNNNISGLEAFNNAYGASIDADGNDYNTFRHVKAYNNTEYGLGIIIPEGGGGECYNQFVNFTSSGSRYGIYLQGAQLENFTNGTSYNNTYGAFVTHTGGFSPVYPSDDVFRNVTIENNTYGVHIQTDGTEWASPVYLINSAARGNAVTDYNSSSMCMIVMNRTDFSGTVISIGNNTGGFNISYPASPPSPPGGYGALGKYVSISNRTSGVSIRNLTFHYTDGEASGRNESRFRMLHHNGTAWETVTGQYVDASLNMVVAYNVSSFSPFGIFENGSEASNISACQDISSPGSYSLSQNLQGAPIPATEAYFLPDACIKISASNVTLDCAGYNITNDGTASASGIVLNGSLINVNLRNCPLIADYTYGIYAHKSNDSLFTNITLRNNSLYGIQLFNSSNNTLANNTASDNSNSGFCVSAGSNGNTLANNTASDNFNFGFTISSGPNNTLANNTAFNNTFGFLLESGSNGNTLANSTAFDNTDGIYISSVSNNTLANNRAYDNSEHGFFVDSSGNGTLANNRAHNNAWSGFYIYSSGNNTLANNRAYDNGGDGIHLASSPNNTLANNTACNNTNFGFSLVSSSNNTLANNTACNGTWSGFFMTDGSSYNNLAGNTAYNNSYAGFDLNNGSDYNVLRNNIAQGISTAGIQLRNDSDRNTLINNTASGAGQGFTLWHSSSNTLINNTACNSSTWDGFHIMDGSSYNNFTGNAAHGNPFFGFDAINVSNYNTFTNNTAWGNPWAGFIFRDDSDNSALANNTAYGNGDGFKAEGNRTNLTGNAAYGNTLRGFAIISSSGSRLLNNSAYGNGGDGFYEDSDSNNTFTNNSAWRNRGAGINLTAGAGTNLTTNRMWNNSRDFEARSGSFNMTANLFLNPWGTLENYTNLSITDAIDSIYTINWTRNSTSLPADRVSFRQKYVNISNQSGLVTLIRIVWHWGDWELSGYDETKFELWRYSSGWVNTGAVLDTGANTLTRTDLDPGTEYGMLQNNETPCVIPANDYLVNTSTTFCGGTYNLADTGSTGVIIANTDNITITCLGTVLVGGGSGTGIYAASMRNVTIQNCFIADYQYGIYLYRPTYSRLINNTLNSSSTAGVYFWDGGSNPGTYYGYNTIENNTIYNDAPGSGYGIYFYAGGHVGGFRYGNLTGNNISRLQYGIYLKAYQGGGGHESRINYNLVANNTINGTSIGIYLHQNDGTAGIQENRFQNNTMRNSTYGFYLQGADTYQLTSNNFTNNGMYNISSYGAYFYSPSGNYYAYRNDFGGTNTLDGYNFYHYYARENITLSGLNLNSSTDASNIGQFSAVQSTNITLRGSNVTGDREYGVYLWDSANMTVDGCTVHDNGDSGTEANIYTYSGLYDSINNTAVYGNRVGIFTESSNTATIKNCRVENTTSYGIYLYLSTADSAINNTIINATTAGIHAFTGTQWYGNYGWISLRNNNISGPGSSGYAIHLRAANHLGYLDYVNLTGNTMQDAQYGLYVQSEAWNGAETHISYSRFTGNNCTNTTTCFWVRQDGTLANMRGNAYENNTLQGSSYGFYMQASDGDGFISNTFTGNAISNMATRGIYFADSYSYHNTFGPTNTFNGRPIYHYANTANVSHSGLSLNASDDATNLGLFSVVNSTNVSLYGSNLSNDAEYGAFLWDSKMLLINGCSIHSNGDSGSEANVYAYSDNSSVINNTAIYGGRIGVYVEESNIGSTVENSRIENTSSYGAYYYRPTGGTLRNTTIRSPTTAGFYAYSGTQWFGDYGFFLLEGNTFYGPASSGYAIYLAAANHLGYLNYMNVTRNTLRDAQYGMYVRSYAYGGAETDIQHSNFTGNNCSNSTTCFYLQQDGPQSILSVNTFEGNSAWNSTYGFYLEASDTDGVIDNNFTNTFANSTTYPLYFVNSNPRYNRFRNTTLISDVSGNFIYNPGATNNFTNTTLQRLGGRINLPLNYTLTQTVGTSNTAINANLASIDTSSLAPLANSPATIGIYINSNGQCPAKVFKKSGFPTTVSDVLANGSLCMPPDCILLSCQNGYVTFNTSNFSGYAASNNTPPNITAPIILPVSPTDTTPLNASANYSDLDNDSGSVTFYWYKNNVNIYNYTSPTVPNNSIVTSNLSIANFTAGDYINVSVQASDGLNFSQVFWSSTKLIASSCTVPYNDYAVNVSTTFCAGTYNLADTGSTGVIIANNNSINITCLGTVLVGGGSGSGIYSGTRSAVTITGCTLQNYSYGINMYRPTGHRVINNTVTRSSTAGIYSYGNGGTYGYSSIENNTVDGLSGASSIYLYAAGGSLYYNNITGNSMGNSTYGIYFFADGGGGVAYVSYSRITDNNCSNTSRCIYLSSSQWSPVMYNVFYNNTLRNFTYGVYLTDDRVDMVTNNNFSDNKLYNMTSYGVYFGDTGSYKNRFWSSNTLNGSSFYHYYDTDNLSLSLDLNASAAPGRDATNLGLFTAVRCRNITLSSSNFTNDREYGIFLYESNLTVISGSTLSSNGDSGNEANAYAFGGAYNSLRNNRVQGGREGIYLNQPVTSSIANNNLTGTATAIHLYNSQGTAVENNTIANATSSGIYAENPYGERIINNTVSRPTSIGIQLYGGSGNYGYSTIENNTINGPSSGPSIYLYAPYFLYYVNVTRNVFGNSTYGLQAEGYQAGIQGYLYYNRITDNNCSNTSRCIYIYANWWGGVMYNVFYNNTLRNSTYGIYLHDDMVDRGTENNFSDNKLYNMTSYGVYFNTAPTYKNRFWGSNTLDGYQFYHYYDTSNLSLILGLNASAAPSRDATNLGLFTAVRCRNITLSSSNFTNDREYGIFLYESNLTTISDSTLAYSGDSGSEANAYASGVSNTFRNNVVRGGREGIYLSSPSSSTVANNSISATTVGIHLASSQNSLVANNTVWATSSYGIQSADPTLDRIINNTVRDATNAGIYLSGSNGYSTVENNTVSGPISGASISLYTPYTMYYVNVTRNNVGNSTYGIYIQGYQQGVTGYQYYHRVTDNTCANSTYCLYLFADMWGAVKYGVFNNNTLRNSTYGIYFTDSRANGVQENDFTNNFVNATSYPLYVSDTTSCGRFWNTTFANDVSSSFIYVAGGGATSNFTNMTFQRLGGRANLPGRYSIAQTVGTANTALNANLVSINTASITNLSGSPAEVSLYINNGGQCPAKVFKKSGFPTTVSDVLVNGSLCTTPNCIPLSCINGYVTFNTSNFSGYAASNNTPPNITTPIILPTSPTEITPLNASANYSDLDNDSGSVTFMWYVDNVNVYNYTSPIVPNNTIITSNLSTANFTAGDYINVSVQASDGLNFSQLFWSPTKLIASSCTVPYNDYAVNVSTTFCGGTYNLADTGSNGVLIPNRDNITITCLGTVINGAGSGMGLYLGSSRANVTTSGCTFANFSSGIYYSTSGLNNRFINNTVMTCTDGIYLVANNGEFSFNTLIGNVDGVHVQNANSNVFRNNTFNGSTTYAIDFFAVDRMANYFSGDRVNGVPYFHCYNNASWAVGNVTLTAPRSSNYGEINIYGCTNAMVQNVNASQSVTHGIFIESSDGVTILNSSAASNGNSGFYVSNSDRFLAANCTLTGNSQRGVYLYASHNATIRECLFQSTSDAIDGSSSSDASISNSTFRSNSGWGVGLSSANGWNVTNNTLVSNGYGIYYGGSGSNNRITNNTIISCTDGIWLVGNSAEISFNTFVSNADGVQVQNGFYNIFRNNTFTGSTTYAINYAGVDRMANYFSGDRVNGHPYLHCYNNATWVAANTSASEPKMTNYGEAIIYQCDDAVLRNVSISSHGVYGVYVTDSDRTLIVNSSISGNTNHGVYLTNDRNTTIRDSWLRNPSTSGVYGTSSYDTKISSNTVRDSNYGIYILSTSGGWNVTNNTVISNTYGIYYSADGANNRISSNNLSGNTNGVGINGDSGTFRSNLITGGQYGVYLNGGTANTLQNTSIINSTSNLIRVWTGTGNFFLNTTLINDASGDYLFVNSGSNTFANVTFQRYGGRATFPNSYTLAQTIGSTNTAINNNLVSVNTASITPLAGSPGVVSLYISNSGQCPARILKKSGFPTTASNVLANGTRCMPPDCIPLSCDSGYITFSTSNFSGYAASNNTPPNITAPAILPASPTDATPLNASATYSDRDNDSGSVTFYWYANGVNVYNYTTPIVLNNTVVTSNLSVGNFTVGDLVNVSVVSSDGINLSQAFWSPTVSIASSNAPPNVTAPTIAPPTAYKSTPLNASTAYTDTDNNTGNVTFMWFVNNLNTFNQTITSVPNGTSVTSNLTPAFFNHTNYVNVSVFAFDGRNVSVARWSTNTLQIQNTPPAITQPTILPSTAYANNSLNASTTITDTDPGDVSNVTFMWFINGTNTYNTTITNVANGSTVTANLSYTNLSHFSIVNVSVFAFDGMNASAIQPSTNTLNISNTPPALTAPAILPPNPSVTDTLNASTTYSDLDLDTASSVTFMWFVNNANVYNQTFGGLANGTSTTSYLSSGNFSAGAVVNVTVRAFDGYNLSAAYSSSQITVQNTPPNVTQPTIAPPSGYKNTTFSASTTYTDTDNNTGNVTFRWYVNGANTFNQTISGVLNGSSVTSNLTSNFFNRSNYVNASVSAIDTQNTSPTAYSTNTVQVQNTPPVASTPGILPAFPTAFNNLNASATYTDLDSDPGNMTFMWFVNSVNVYNQTIIGITNGSTVASNLSSTNFTTGSTVNVTARAFDGMNYSQTAYSASVTVGNVPPVVTPPTITPPSGYKNTTFSASTTYTNTESGNVTFLWFVNNINVYNQTITNVPNGTSVTSNLTPAFFNRSDILNVSVSAFDGMNVSPVVWSTNTLQVQNTPPIASTPSILPAFPTAYDTLNASSTYADLDSDQGNMTFMWFVNSVNVYNQTITGMANGSIAISFLSPSNFTTGATVNVTARAFDGMNYSGPAYSSQVFIWNVPPVVTPPTIAPPSGYKNTTFSASTTYTNTESGNVTFLWYVNGINTYNQTITSVPNGTSVTSNLTPAFFNRSSIINASVFAFDGINISATQASANTVQVSNTPPVVTAPTIAPATGYKNTTFNASITFTDADPGDVSNVTFLWYVNGINTYNQTLFGVTNGSTVTSNLSSQYFNRTDSVSLSVFAFDGMNASATQASTNSIIVQNTPPAISAVTLLPIPLYAGQNSNASINYTDLDLDTGTITFMWFVNNTNVYNATAAGIPNGTAASGLLPPAWFNASDLINVTVFAVDSAGNASSAASSGTATVLQSPINSVNVTPNSGYAGDLISFYANVTNATEVNVSFGGVTLVLSNDSATGWNYTNYTLPALGEGTYTVTFTAMVNGALFTSSSTFTMQSAAPPPPPSPPSPPTPTLSLSYQVVAPANKVTFSTEPGASIRLLLTNPYSGMVGSGTANPAGKWDFTLTQNGTYEATATLGGYRDATATFRFTTWSPPPIVPPPNVTPPNVTPPITPPVTPPVTPGGPGQNITANCTMDSQCAAELRCSGGVCIPVEQKECGFVANHSWFDYSCCKNNDCQPGYRCDNHACLQKKVTIALPNETRVGDTEDIAVTVDGKPAEYLTLQVTRPDGSTSTLTTDSKGRASLKMEFQGEYKVSVIERGVTIKSGVLTALPKGIAEAQPRPFAFLEDNNVRSGFLALAILAMLAFIFYRFVYSRGKAVRQKK